MRAGAALANTAWIAAGLPAAWRFARALRDPRGAQERWLRAQLARHAASDFGQAHDFAAIRDPDDFARRVPLTDYDALVPHLDRIVRGERDVLACDRVTHLAPTSGTTRARKLIPFTPALQQHFSAAVSPWLVDLVRQRPALLGGPGYWSVSPLSEADHDEGGAGGIPVGFAEDAEYLGGAAAWMASRALAVPSSVRHVRDVAAFRALTLLALLRQRELRLISIWHPSFLELITGAAEPYWPELLDAIASGGCPWAEAVPAAARAWWRAAPDPARTAELRRLGAADWARWWPRLQALSCWGDQAAEPGWARLRRLLPHVLVQAKGLLATEAVVTIPLGGGAPLAVTSHYFEFLDRQGGIRRAHELERGAEYEVVVSNGGGLWRYRLGDVVECAGFVHATPSLRFLGRAGRVSDLRGEKLSEAFVAGALRHLWTGASRPAYVALRARDDADGARYELLVSAEALREPAEALEVRLDAALGANPHYALARRLGQLGALRVVVVAEDAARAELERHTGRLGEAKPAILIGAALDDANARATRREAVTPGSP